MAFFLAAACLTAAALAIALYPLWRRGRAEASAPSLADSTVAAFRMQRRELDADFANGRIDAETRDRARDELAARLAAEMAADTAAGGDAAKPQAGSGVSGPPLSRSARWLGWGMALFICLGTAGGYALFGQRISVNPAAETATSTENGGEIGAAQLASMVAALAQKMEANPQDARGWTLLARSQAALGQLDKAAAAYERAVALVPGDASLLADYADLLVARQNGDFRGKPYDLIQRALKVNPAEPKALAIAGVAEMRLGNKVAALAHWQKLRSVLPADSPDIAQLDAIIADLRAGKTTPSSPAVAPSPTPVAASGTTLTGRITLAPALAARIGKGAVLFILARAVSDDPARPAPRAPLAVMRLPVPDRWPHAFELSDAMAMAPGLNLSAFPMVTVEARIAQGGNAQRQAGDLFGITPPIAAHAKGIALAIDQVAP